MESAPGLGVVGLLGLLLLGGSVLTWVRTFQPGLLLLAPGGLLWLLSESRPLLEPLVLGALRSPMLAPLLFTWF